MKRTLALHPFNGGDYYLGAFLLGAYQEILGDLHNLFGDTNAVHVRLGPTGEVILDSVIKGDTVREVLDYVQFNADALVSRLRRDVEAALREGRLTYEESGVAAQVLRRRPARLHVSRRRPRAVAGWGPPFWRQACFQQASGVWTFSH